MKKYIIHGWSYGNHMTVVEAESEEEAIEEAMNNRSVASLCHQCAEGGEIETEWLLPYEFNEIIEITSVEEDWT